jgi:hypothetical protein
MVADCASKSILRAAVEMLLLEDHPNVFYWPSFEVIHWFGSHLPRPTFGLPEQPVDTRHVSEEVVHAIIDTFVDTFFD